VDLEVFYLGHIKNLYTTQIPVTFVVPVKQLCDWLW